MMAAANRPQEEAEGISSTFGANARIAVVLPAAGSGLRVGAPTPKQYWMMSGKPLIYFTLTTLDGIKAVEEVVVPVAEDMVPVMEDNAKAWGLTKTRFVVGSTTRHRSIYAGIKSLAASQPDIVVVHDAVRPFVDEASILKVAKAASDYGAAGLVLPLVSTVVKPDAEGFLQESLDRSQYRASQTPQAFAWDVINRAYESCTQHDFDHGTECLHLALTYSHVRAKLVDGTPNLWKVTYKQDLHAAAHQVKLLLRKVAVVFGAGRGIGREIVRGFRDQGLEVVAMSRTEDELKALERETGCVAFPGDVSDVKQVEAALEAAQETFGRVDIVVNNAGVATLRSIEDTPDEVWHQVMQTNVSGTFYACRAAFATMRASGRGGVIVSIGSSSTCCGRPDQGAYAASKAAVQCLTETLSIEGRPHHIRAYSIIPRRTDTKLRQELYPDEDKDTLLTPQQVAEVTVAVSMDANPLLSGQAFYVR